MFLVIENMTIFTQGIASLEMVLSNDPPLGTWSIKAIYNDSKEYSNTFSVEEYGNDNIKRARRSGHLYTILISFKRRAFYRNVESLF